MNNNLKMIKKKVIRLCNKVIIKFTLRVFTSVTFINITLKKQIY